jgi:hypothetical protein
MSAVEVRELRKRRKGHLATSGGLVTSTRSVPGIAVTPPVRR